MKIDQSDGANKSLD